MRTGEVREHAEAKLLRDEEVSERAFDLVMSVFSRAGLEGLVEYGPVLAHYDRWYGLKYDPNTGPHWFLDRGGHHPGLVDLQNRLRQRVSGII